MSASQTLGKHEIRRQLGRGAMGVVYEGWDPIIKRQVAIKTVRLPVADDDETAGEIERFRREAEAAGRLNHPNIVGVFDYGETGDLAYIVMEFVDGPTVKALLDRRERFALPKIAGIMEDLLSGLQFSHERGVVHRDIKPANLMLTQSGQTKIADFGIARLESSSMTQTGAVLGTPAYMSPEQFRGEVVDARSDIYFLGVLLYQLLTGERPFDGSMATIMHKALNAEALPPSRISPSVPRQFDGVVKRAMAKRPEDRYASAKDFAAAIRAAATASAPAPEAPDAGEMTLIAPQRSRPPTAAPLAPPRPEPVPAAGAPRARPDLSARPAVVTARAARGADPMPAPPARPAPATAPGGPARPTVGAARDGPERSALATAPGGPARPAVGAARDGPASGRKAAFAAPAMIGAAAVGLAVLGGVGYLLLSGTSLTPLPAGGPSGRSVASAPTIAAPAVVASGLPSAAPERVKAPPAAQSGGPAPAGQPASDRPATEASPAPRATSPPASVLSREAPSAQVPAGRPASEAAKTAVSPAPRVTSSAAAPAASVASREAPPAPVPAGRPASDAAKTETSPAPRVTSSATAPAASVASREAPPAPVPAGRPASDAAKTETSPVQTARALADQKASDAAKTEAWPAPRVTAPPANLALREAPPAQTAPAPADQKAADDAKTETSLAPRVTAPPANLALREAPPAQTAPAPADQKASDDAKTETSPAPRVTAPPANLTLREAPPAQMAPAPIGTPAIDAAKTEAQPAPRVTAPPAKLALKEAPPAQTSPAEPAPAGAKPSGEVPVAPGQAIPAPVVPTAKSPAEASQPSTAPPVSAPPVPPLVPPPAPAPLSPLERLRQAALAVPCSVLAVADEPSGPKAMGLAAAGPELDRFSSETRAAGGNADMITRPDRFACGPIEAVAAIARRSWEGSPRSVTLTLDHPEPVSGTRAEIAIATVLHNVYADLYMADGSVHHLARPAASRNQNDARVVSFVAPAPGAGLVVVLGSAKPLDLGVRPQVEKAATWLAVLQSRLRDTEPPPAADLATLLVRPAEPAPPKPRPELPVAARLPPVAPPVASVRPTVPAAAKVPAPPAALRSGRCSNIVSRAQLGETLSDAEIRALRTECRS